MRLRSVSQVWFAEEFIILGAAYSFLIFGGAAILAIFIRSFIKPMSGRVTQTISLPTREIESTIRGETLENPERTMVDSNETEEVAIIEVDLGTRVNFTESNIEIEVKEVE